MDDNTFWAICIIAPTLFFAYLIKKIFDNY